MKAIAKTLTQPFVLPSTYLKAALFVALSVLTPMLLHQFSLAGTVLMPILFITFLAALRFGWAVGLLSAVASPLVSYALTGMPPGLILYVVLAQCIAIALLVGIFSKDSFRITFWQVAVVIIVYQLIAFILETLFFSASIAFYGIWDTIPGMLIQLLFFTRYSQILLRRKS